MPWHDLASLRELGVREIEIWQGMGVDIDAFVWANQRDWDRLSELTRKRVLTGAEADELVRLYLRTATHLSIVRSTAPEPALISDLSMRIARARGRIDSIGDFSMEACLGVVLC